MTRPKLTKHTLENGLRTVSTITELAEKLGVGRVTIYRTAKRLGIDLARPEPDTTQDDTVKSTPLKPLPTRELRRDSAYSGRCLGDVGRRR